MSSWVLHQNQGCFPNPTKFDPERWLGADSHQAMRMEKAFIPFGKGTRGCVGMPYVFFPFFPLRLFSWLSLASYRFLSSTNTTLQTCLL
jgi:hypothetical protein